MFKGEELVFLKINDLTKSYGGLAANSNVNIEILENSIVGLIGPNGAGKSTLFQCIQGFTAASSGSIVFQGEELTGLRTPVICKKGIA